MSGQEKMRALVKAKAEPGLWMEEVPVPQPGPNDVVIKVKKSAICGTDLHIFKWDTWAQQTIAVPMVVGHEFVGEIAALGSAVTGYQVGQRVSGEGHLTCEYCRNCRAGKRHLCRNTKGVGLHVAGSFAEYLCIPWTNVFPIPDDISDDLASILDPFGNAVHTAISFDLVGEDVLITGAGPIGLMGISIARHVGARHIVITDINEYRLDLARKMGVTRAVNVTNENLNDVMKDLNMLEGFDVGLEMSGSPAAFRSMLEVANNGARIAILGIFADEVAIDWSEVIFKGLFLKGIYGREMYETWYKGCSMLQSGLDVEQVITHRLPIDDYLTGFELMQAGQCGKVILNW